MLECADCGKVIQASENKFKFEEEDEPGPVYVCNTCGNKRVAQQQQSDD